MKDTLGVEPAERATSAAPHRAVVDLLRHLRRRVWIALGVEYAARLAVVCSCAALAFQAALEVRPDLVSSAWLFDAAALVPAALLLFVFVPREAAASMRFERFWHLVEERLRTRFPHNELLTAAEYSDPALVRRYGVSEALVRALDAEAGRRLRGVGLGSIFDCRRLSCWCVLAFVLAAAFFAAVPDPSDRSFVISKLSLGMIGDWAACRVSLTPVPDMVLRGRKVRFSVRVEPPPSSPPLLYVRAALGRAAPRRVVMERAGDGWSAAITATDAFRWMIVIGLRIVAMGEVEVTDPPSCVAMRVRLTYPRYTGLAPEIVEGGRLDLVVPAGTGAVLEGEADRPLARAAVVYREDGELRLPGAPLRIEGRSFAGEVSTTAEADYAVLLVDGNGFSNEDGLVFYHVRPMEDRPPVVTILSPPPVSSVSLRRTSAVELEVQADDDYGISSLDLEYSISRPFNSAWVPERVRVPLWRPPSKRASAAARSLTTSWRWELEPLGLMPGDVVLFEVSARDNAEPVAGEGRSPRYRLEVPLETALVQKAFDQTSELLEKMSDVAGGQEEFERQTRQLLDRLRRKGERLAWKDRKELETMARREELLRRRAMDLVAKMRKVMDVSRDEGLLDMDTLRKMEEFKRLFQEVADKRMKETMRRLRELMSGMKLDKAKLSRLMRKMDAKEISRRLDRMIAGLKRLKMKREVRGLAESLRRLASREAELRMKVLEHMAEAARGNPPSKEETDRLAEAQRRLAAEQQQGRRMMERLARRMAELSPSAEKAMRDAAGRFDSLRILEHSRIAGSMLQRCNLGEAASRLEKSASGLGEIARMVERSANAMGGKRLKVELSLIEEALGELRLVHERTSRAALWYDTLSRAVSPMPSDKRSRWRVCSRTAAGLGAAVEVLDSLRRRLASGLPDEYPRKLRVIDDLERASDMLREAVSALEQLLLYQGAERAADASVAAADAFLRLLRLYRTMKNASQSGQGGGEELMEQLESLARQQERLNKMLSKVASSGLDDPILRELLERMAAQQELIRRSIEEMARRMRRSEGLARKLRELAGQMKEVERRLREGGTDSSLEEKQRRILTRMLDYSKSLHKQDYSRKRKAERPDEYVPIRPPALSDSSVGAAREHSGRALPAAAIRPPSALAPLVERYLGLLRTADEAVRGGGG